MRKENTQDIPTEHEKKVKPDLDETLLFGRFGLKWTAIVSQTNIELILELRRS